MFSDKLVAGLMERYGRAVRILSPEENAAAIDCRAFVQPLRYKNKMYLNGVYLPSGYDDGRHYLYLGPADELGRVQHRLDICINLVLQGRILGFQVNKLHRITHSFLSSALPRVSNSP